MVTSGGANFSVMTVSPRRTFTRKWYRPVSAETGGPYRANRVPGRTLGGTTAFQRAKVAGVAAHAVQRENLMQATHAQCQLSQDSFPALAWSGSVPGKNARPRNTCRIGRKCQRGDRIGIILCYGSRHL